MKLRAASLRNNLETLRMRYDKRFLHTDPLIFPRSFKRKDDREVVGLIASSLAYGNVKTISANVRRLMDWMGPRPADFARNLNPKLGLYSLGEFQHRWTRARDVVCLVHFAGRMLDNSGSIGNFFEKGYKPGNISSSINQFSIRALNLDHGGLYSSCKLPSKAGVRFFFTNTMTGACKRLNMYLRWMVRSDDGLDLGLWQFIPTNELIIPLDTHIFRIGHHLGWTHRKTLGFRTAIDITENLAFYDPLDPVKYDFALSRMGMLKNCPRHDNPQECELCQLQE